MVGVHCCQRVDPLCSSCFTCNVFSGRVKLYMASSQQLAASRKRSSLEKERVFDVFSCILPSIVKRETTDRHHENIQSLLPGIQNAYLLILGYISKENEEQGASLLRQSIRFVPGRIR